MSKKEKVVDGMTMGQWIAKETKKRKTSWWGEPCFITPVIHPEIFGDGLQLAYLGTIDQRPNYWLIRIDSSINLEADDFDYESNLLQPLEDYFGRFPEPGYIDAAEFKKLKKNDSMAVQDYENYKDYSMACKYPALYWGGGHWGSVVNFK
ncbi:MAG: hypothetical protein V4547_17630 [Bacteroidota bacterium]